MATADRPAFRFAVGPTVAGMDCGCGECPECCPGVAEAARLADWSFHDALALVRKATDATLRRLVDLDAPPTNRAAARRAERQQAKAAKATVRAANEVARTAKAQRKGNR